MQPRTREIIAREWLLLVGVLAAGVAVGILLGVTWQGSLLLVSLPVYLGLQVVRSVRLAVRTLVASRADS